MKRLETKFLRFTSPLLTLVGCVALLTSCTNIRVPSTVITAITASPSTSAVKDAYTIVTATPTTLAASPNGNIINLGFDISQTPDPINIHCSSTGKPCNCTFTWNETNTSLQSSTTSSSITRNVVTPAIVSQSNQLTCVTPDDYVQGKIIDGTQIIIGVVTAGTDIGFSVTPLKWIKNSAAETGSFQDSQGHYFDNILRYTCYERFQRGMTVTSQVSPQTNPTPGVVYGAENVSVPVATSFCLATGTVTASANCPGLQSASSSSQANYYNLYIRNSEVGDINTGNDRYACPMVQESLVSNTGSNATQGNFYPLDSTFALSMGVTPNFTIGVVAYSTAADGQDPVTAGAGTCFTSTPGSPTTNTSSSNTTSLVPSCLGFAAPVKSGGTCPQFYDANGNVSQTYRLRRYIALYPRVYDVTGKVYVPSGQTTGTQASDTIYVLDRPVTGTGNTTYTMLGPKPCPAAYFDTKGSRANSNAVAPVCSATFASGVPGYGSTNDACWAGVNVDGIQFPNQDIYDAILGVYSCSAEIPYVSPASITAGKPLLSMVMVNANNTVAQQALGFPKSQYIRPIQQPWAAHYEEDTSFQACAPLPQGAPTSKTAPAPIQLRDPPLHFAKNGTNTAYCAEVYPSQNSNPAALDNTYKYGLIKTSIALLNNTLAGTGGAPYAAGTGTLSAVPFTSHIPKNSTSAVCASGAGTTAVPLAGTFSAYGAGVPYATGTYNNHPSAVPWDSGNMAQTCDRTELTTNLDWMQFPLLAKAVDVETALASDPTFNCAVTWDNSNLQAKALNGVTPTNGCCGASITGYPAHLEPAANPAAGSNCQTPTY